MVVEGVGSPVVSASSVGITEMRGEGVSCLCFYCNISGTHRVGAGVVINDDKLKLVDIVWLSQRNCDAS